MARYHNRINPVDECSQSPQVRMVDSIGAANRETNCVNGDWVVTRKVGEELGGVWISQEVLGMYFKACDSGTRGDHFRDMGKPETDAGGVGPPVCSLGEGHVESSAHAFGFKLPPTMRSQ
jgi:hypothetical protein